MNTASFEFSGSESAAAFACQLDEQAFGPCASPWSYSDLSKGEHTVRVRAIDAAGNVDLTPASFTWTVNATTLDATITGSPANPSTSRQATFAFTGTGSGFACSLDGAAFTTCTNPTAYSNLSYREHSFQVRAVNGTGENGVAARYPWTTLNPPPVASDQMLTTLEDEALAVTLTASDEDALTFSVVTPPAHGVLVGA
nr:hypothetical protein [Caldilineaceae bacterium]